MARIDRILRAFEAEPWAIQPKKLEQLAEVLCTKAEAGQIPEQPEIEAAAARQRSRGRTTGATAVLPLMGTISRRMNMMDAMSGGSSIELFQESFNEALADDSIGTIVIQIDSPGGSVYGVDEMASMIYAARSQKRIIAIADSLAASAAYYIGSAASEFVVTPSGEVGSIGVFMAHFDITDALEEEGVKVTIIRAGENKAEGNPYEALSDEAAAHMQSLVDDYYAQFVGAVAKHRGISVETVEDDFGQGRTYTADRALARGMVDRVATLDDIIGEIHGTTTTTRRRMHARALDKVASSDFDTTEGLEPLAAVAQAATRVFQAFTKADGVAGQTPVAVSTTAPTHTAPEARRKTMSVTDTAAPDGVERSMEDVRSEALAEERSRVSEINAIAREHGIDASVSEQWVSKGMSVDAVRAAALDVIKSRSASDVIRVGHDRAEEAPFTSFADQLGAVINAGTPGGKTDPRLRGLNRIYGAATGGSQGDPSSGGFLVAPQFSQRIWDGLNDDPDNLVARTDSYVVEGESLTFNANAETSRATGSRWGGVQSYWIAEADQITSSKPKFRQAKVEPQQLAVMVYLTDKLLRNAPQALEQYTERAAVSEIGFMGSNAIVRGTGAGQPLGLLNSASLVTVAKESSQATATILQANISKMWARLHPRARRDALWLHNVDCEPEMDNLFHPVTNVAGTENVGGFSNGVYDQGARMLKGRPLVAAEFCSTLGTVGDLILWSPSGYLAGIRGGVESDMSIHIRFDYAETAFRFMYEIDGQPWLASALTPFQGTNTLSTHVALATRS